MIVHTIVSVCIVTIFTILCGPNIIELVRRRNPNYHRRVLEMHLATKQMEVKHLQEAIQSLSHQENV